MCQKLSGFYLSRANKKNDEYLPYINGEYKIVKMLFIISDLVAGTGGARRRPAALS